MAYNYVVTAQKSTSVTHSITAHFTSPNDTNLLIAKGTRFEIHLLSSDGVIPQHDINLYGRITLFEAFRPKHTDQDWLFILTQRYQYCVLAYDTFKQQIITKANGTIRDSIGRASEVISVGNIDPDARMIGMNLYEGYFKVIPMEYTQGGKYPEFKDPFNIRLEELRVIDIVFLHGFSRPTICVLYEDYHGHRHLKTYHLLMKEKDFMEGPWSKSNLDKDASLLIPVAAPIGGVLVVSCDSIQYINSNTWHRITIQQSSNVSVFETVDASEGRFLIADQGGILSVVALTVDISKNVTGVLVDVLGTTNIPSSLSYLNQGVVFVGSSYGDSQLIQLKSERNPETQSCIEVLDTHVNIGPIIDFVVMDLDRQGQGQIVTCSGAEKDGSLRVIRNGIGINEQARADISGIKNLWSLRSSFSNIYDTYLAQSYVNEIRLLALDDDNEMTEAVIPGFLTVGKTLLMSNVIGDGWLQVVENQIRVVSAHSKQVVCEWRPHGDSRITLANANPTQLVIATSDGNVIYFEVNAENLQLNERACIAMEHEIACIDISPLPKVKEDVVMHANDANAMHWEAQDKSSNFCVVGLWMDFSICVLSLPTLQIITKEILGDDMLPRSVLLATLDARDYLFVGLGDGSLLNFHINSETGVLGNRRLVSLGSQPITLRKFRAKNEVTVFAACDRPTVIYSSNGKVLYSNVNTNEVTVMTPFHAASFPECLALACDDQLVIGTVDEIQKLHIESFHLGEWARRLAHAPQAHALGVLTIQYDEQDNERGFVRLVDDQTFDVLDGFTLEPFEIPCSIVATMFQSSSGTSSENSTSYIVVGTAYVRQDEQEPHAGRLLLFAITGHHGDRKLVLVTDLDVKGAIYCLLNFQGKILAGVNSIVQLYTCELVESTSETNYDRSFQLECEHVGHVLALYLESRDDNFIIVGDLMKSIALLQYKENTSDDNKNGSIEEIAKDLNSNWMTAIAILNHETFIGSETDCNLFCLQRNSGATSDEDRGRLETIGEYHVGEFINRFRYGSLVMQQANQTTTGSSMKEDEEMKERHAAHSQQTMLFGTVSGMIGVILPLSKDQYEWLLQLQAAITSVVHGVGGFTHKDWRAFENRRVQTDAKNFIDGDVIESFVELKPEDMNRVVELLKVEGNLEITMVPSSVDEVLLRIEEFAQMH